MDLIERPCWRCGASAKRTEPGVGPHALRLLCGACGCDLGWLPKGSTPIEGPANVQQAELF